MVSQRDHHLELRHLSSCHLDSGNHIGALIGFARYPRMGYNLRVNPIRSYLSTLHSFGRNARLYVLFSFTSGFSVAIYALFFNLYIASLGKSSSFLGILVALPMAVNLLFALPAGLLGDRIGYRRGLLMGTFLTIASIVGIALSSSSSWLLAFSVVSGLGNSLIWVMGAPFMMENSLEEGRTHLFSVQFSMNTFSGFFGFLIGGSLPGLFAHFLGAPAGVAVAYRATLLVSAGLLGVAIMPLFFLHESKREGPPEAVHLKGAFAEPGLTAKLFIPEIVIGLGAGLVVPYFNLFFKQTFAVSDGLLGTLFAGQSIAIGIATLAGPLVAARWGKIRAVAATQIMSIPFLLMLGYSNLLTFAAVGFLARAALMNMGGPLYSAFAMEKTAPRRRAVVNGMLTMSWSGSFAVSNWVSGHLQETVGFSPLFLIMCIAYVIGASLTYIFFARDETRASD